MRRCSRITEDEKKIVIETYCAGASTQSAAREANISTGAAYAVLKRSNVLRTRSESHKGIKPSPRQVARIAALHKGKHLSEETRRKISESRKMHGAGHRKLRMDGYVAVFYPDHPASNKEGYVMEHRLVMEQSIGRYLRSDEVVHHINRNRADNQLENLALMTAGEHMSMHMRERHAERRKIKSIS